MSHFKIDLASQLRGTVAAGVESRSIPLTTITQKKSKSASATDAGDNQSAVNEQTLQTDTNVTATPTSAPASEADTRSTRRLNEGAEEANTPTPPTGGTVFEPVTSEGGLRAWIVVAGSSLSFFVVLGLVYSFGVMQAELLRRNYASSSTLGWVSSTTVVFMPLLAMPITALVRKTSNRFVGLLGALCSGLGYFTTSYTFDKPVWALFVAQSVFGLGYALMFWSCNSLAGQYFVRKRGVAVGIVYAGSGVGGAIFSVGLSRLIRHIGLEAAVRVYGIVALAVLIPTSLTFRSNAEVRVAAFEVAYLKQVNFVLLFVATAIITFSLFVPPFILPSYAVAAGMTAETGAWLVAGYNLASAVGRLLFGVLADSRMGPLTSLCLAMLLMAVSILAIWMAAGNLLAPLIVSLLINGAAGGALLSLQQPVVTSLYGVAATPALMAMVTMSRALGSALGPAIAGYLLDVSSGGAAAAEAARKAAADGQHANTLGTRPYLLPLGVMGAISLVAAGVLAVLRWRLAGMDLKKRV